MEFRDSPAGQQFRANIRAFLDAELPHDLATIPQEWGLFNASARDGRTIGDSMKRWTAKLNARGWGAPHWPREYGGGGLTVREQFILAEEFALRHAPRPGGIGHGWAGPTIMLYGSPEQKERYLPRIVSGEDHWCQLFSEPGAGSDLAGLQTRATRQGDGYVVNGQKIWTSGAHLADMGILLARTDPGAPKHRGVSYFLLDMHTPGITVRPLVNMANNHQFNQVFLEDVRIPRSALLGEENRGWYLATTTLDYERSGIAGNVAHQLIVRDLVAFAANSPESTLRTGAPVRHELADRALEAQVGRLLCYRVITLQERGLVPNNEASIAKLYSSELDVRLSVTAMRLAGLHAQSTGRDLPTGLAGRLARFYLYATTSPVGGGTSEIQRNIIAGRGLGLPR